MKGRGIATISRPFYTIIQYKIYFQQYFPLCFLDQVQENKANSSYTRRNNIQSLVLRCQDKRQVVRGVEFYAGNVDNLFGNMLVHISSYQHTKSAPTEVGAPKNANPDCCYTKPDKRDNGIRHTTCWNLRFYQIQK